MLNYAMTYPGKFPPKFELSNSSHARKEEESCAMHTIIQSEWSGGTARVQSECAHALRQKFELSNSSHVRKGEESFAMHTIVQSEWSGGTARKVSLHILKFLAYRQNIYPTPFLPDHKSHFPCFLLPSLLSYSRFLALAVSHPTAGVAMVFFKDISSGSSSGDYSFTTWVCLSSLSRAMTWNEGFLPDGRFESFLPLVAP